MLKQITLTNFENFVFKLFTNILNIQPANLDSYQKCIHFLTEKETQCHIIYQSQKKVFIYGSTEPSPFQLQILE